MRERVAVPAKGSNVIYHLSRLTTNVDLFRPKNFKLDSSVQQ